MTDPSDPAVTPENRTRGTLLALLILPAGIIAWTIIWSIGYISGIVGIGVALGALALYRRGSGGRISMNGAARVSGIIVVTLLVAFFVGVIAADPLLFSRAMRTGRVFQAFGQELGLYETGGLVINILLLVAFTVLGVFTVFRTAVTQARQQPPVTDPPA
ncbi:MAG: putative rane protein [Schumannella sp.]|nr:putative rane protein [Schumannella sp.]